MAIELPSGIEEEVAALRKRGRQLRLVGGNGQLYVAVAGLWSPTPPWDTERQDILIAIPASYPSAALDSCYVALPVTFNGAQHPRIQGDEVDCDGRRWKLASWHYGDGRGWTPGQDNLDTHITHCAGLFLHRGAVNAR